MKEAKIVSIQVGLVKTLERKDASKSTHKTWTPGLFKTAVYGPVRVGKLSLDGDAQANLVAHGGVDKAVNAYPAEHYSHWRQNLPQLDMSYGAFGENFTTSGLLEDEVCIGDVFKTGNAIVQISQPRQPCWKLEQRWGVKDFMSQVNKTGKTGWYLRVLQEGYVEAGNEIVLVERPFPQWTIARANAVMRNRKTDPLSAWTLARCAALAPSWQQNLRITNWLPKTIWQQCVRFGKKASKSLQKCPNPNESEEPQNGKREKE